MEGLMSTTPRFYETRLGCEDPHSHISHTGPKNCIYIRWWEAAPLSLIENVTIDDRTTTKQFIRSFSKPKLRLREIHRPRWSSSLM